MKKDILIQNPDNLSYVGLCSNNQFRLKKEFKEGDGFKEYVIIEPTEDGRFRLKTFEPLSNIEAIYDYVEECFYHLIPHIPLTKEERISVMKYFGESVDNY